MFYANFWFLNSLCTLSYTSQKCFCILCSLVTKILKNVVILFSKTWPDKTKSSNIMCIWCLKARENLKILIWHKSFVHPIPVCLLEFNKVGCTDLLSETALDIKLTFWYWSFICKIFIRPWKKLSYSIQIPKLIKCY